MRQRLIWWMVVAAVLGLQNSGWASEAAPRCRLTRVVDTHTPIPGGTGTFERVDLLGLEGSTVLLQCGRDANPVGLYTAQEGRLHVVADMHTPIPGGTGTFTNFVDSRLNGATVAFTGQGATGQAGLYTAQ